MEVWTPNNKHTVRAGHRTGTASSQGDVAETPAMFNPLLAYDRGVLDPCVDTDRDEGEPRLALLRPALYMAKRDKPDLVSPDSPDSFAALITTNETLRFAVHQSLFKGDAPWKPKVHLLAPTTKTFCAETVDCQLPEHLRVECIPVKGSDRVCALNWPKHKLPAPKLVLNFPKRHLDQKEAYAQITRGAEPETLDVVIINDQMERRDLTLTNVKAVVIDRLLSPITTSVAPPKPLPELPGELPLDLQSAIADFWQHQMRCHVVATVCAPDMHTRPLAFESIKVTRAQDKRLVLRATLHPSSIKCACKLHALKPMEERFPSERFTGSEVDMTLSMCGHKRPRMASGLYDECPIHGASTPNVELFPSICCHSTVASLGCSHFTPAGKQKKARRKSGMWIPDLGLDGLNLLQAQGLMAAASMADSKLTPMLGKRPAEEISEVCERAEKHVERIVDEITRRRAAEGEMRSDADMITLDMAAVDALRDGKYRRHITASCEVLAKDDADGGVVKCTKADADKNKGPPLELAQTHLYLFRPPLPKRRRAY